MGDTVQKKMKDFEDQRLQALKIEKKRLEQELAEAEKIAKEAEEKRFEAQREAEKAE